MDGKNTPTNVKLQVLICTLGADGLQRVLEMQLPVVPGVGYLVSCQDPDGEACKLDVRQLAARADFELHFFSDRGLSNNRNHALDCASASYVLIGDDDLEYEANGLKAVIRKFDENPDLDFATFMYAGADNKVYPDGEHDLDVPFPRYYISSVELAFRLSSVKSSGLRFSPLAGLGAPYLLSGEEEILVNKALRKGLKGRFFPVLLAVHADLSTGTRLTRHPGVLRAKGAVLRICRGPFAGLIRVPLEARRAPVPFFKALVYLLQGYMYSIVHRKEL